MNGSLAQIIRASALMLTVAIITACGTGPRDQASPKPVGAKSLLGRTLTANHWCTPPTNDADPRFTELDVRQNGQYIKTFHRLQGDNSLARLGQERGTWAIVGDQFMTRTMREARTRQKMVLNASTTVTASRGTGGDSTETCFNLSDAGGIVTESYCSCPVND